MTGPHEPEPKPDGGWEDWHAWADCPVARRWAVWSVLHPLAVLARWWRSLWP